MQLSAAVVKCPSPKTSCSGRAFRLIHPRKRSVIGSANPARLERFAELLPCACGLKWGQCALPSRTGSINLRFGSRPVSLLLFDSITILTGRTIHPCAGLAAFSAAHPLPQYWRSGGPRRTGAVRQGLYDRGQRRRPVPAKVRIFWPRHYSPTILLCGEQPPASGAAAAARGVVNWVCFVKLLRIDRCVLSYADVDIHDRGRRDPLAGPYRLEPLQLMKGSRPGSGQRGFMSPQICKCFRVHSERPCRYD